MGKCSIEFFPHADDPVRHGLNLSLPLSVQFRACKDGIGNSGTVQRRIGVHRPNNDLQLTVDPLLLFRVLGRKRECTNTFAVETHVLSERLAESDLVSLRNEVADGKGITGSITRGETLVGHVEEGEELLLSDNIGDLSPLGLGWVNPGRVVGTSVEENDSTFWCVLRTEV